jgi:uncharacterized protein (TIGR03067 family)
MSVFFCLAAAALLGAEDVSKADLAKLQGTWQLIAMETEGHDIAQEEIKDATAVYEGNRLTLLAGTTVRRRGLVTLEANRTPKAMNTWDQDGPYEDQTVPGIYSLNGDTLILCFARPGEERPKEFTTKAGTGFLRCVYKRRKP